VAARLDNMTKEPHHSNGHDTNHHVPRSSSPKLNFMMTSTEEHPAFRPVHGFHNVLPVDGQEGVSDSGGDAASSSTSSLKWFCPPEGDAKTDGWWKRTETGSLEIAAPAKKDFWRKTFYEPLLVKDDAPFLYSVVPLTSLPATIETSFTITNAASQFDQAGIIIRLDAEHWIKTGVEVVDGLPRLSCVVTNGFSDWSTQTWSEPKLSIRVHMLPQNGGSFVVEAAPLQENDPAEKSNIGAKQEKEWSLVRICHMNKDMSHDFLNGHPTVQSAYRGESAPPNTVMAGVFAACPIDQNGSCVVRFHDISIVEGSSFVHTA
jgi:regulation of enolase protein 1 (concanavalin A-like superfamily)